MSYKVGILGLGVASFLVTLCLVATPYVEVANLKEIQSLDSDYVQRGKGKIDFDVDTLPDIWQPGVEDAFKVNVPTNKAWVGMSSDSVGIDGVDTFVVARSQSSCVVGEQARLESEMVAVDLAADKLSLLYGEKFVPQLLNYTILDRHDIIEDQFSQVLTSDFSTVYRRAILLDFSREKLDLLLRINQQRAKEIETERVATVTRLGSTILVMTTVIVVIFGLYFMFDAATRGYYSAVIKAIAVLATLGICIFVSVRF